MITKLLRWGARAATAFDSWAPTYEAEAERLIRARGYSYAAIAGAVVNDLGPENSTEILEVGTGPGNLGREVVTVAPEAVVQGVDISERMLGLARTKGVYRVTARASAERLPFPTEEFRGIVCAFVLHSVFDQARALAEFRRVLRPGGRAVVIDLCPSERGCGYALRGFFHSLRRECGAPARYRPVEDYVRLALDQGFEVLRVRSLGEIRKYSHYLLTLGKPR